MSTALVTVEELMVRYGDLVAVDGVSFTADAGSILAVLGPNGAGKTSTVETLEGYRRPAAGRVRVCGLDPVADHRQVTGLIGVMLQSGGIPNQMRVGEALTQYASFYPVPLDTGALAERMGLADRMRTTWRQLSGGEKQRLSLALAVIGRPRVAFLDEPTAGVDPAGRQVVRKLVGELRDQGVCVVLTTHDLADVEHLADRVLIMDRGRVLANGTPAELTGGTADSFRFTPGPASGADAPDLDISALSAALGTPVRRGPSGQYIVEGTADPQRVARLTQWLADAGLGLAGLHTGSRSLEDVYLELTGGDIGEAAT
jgi:ABC-2 type transport system ATP-binding protein